MHRAARHAAAVVDRALEAIRTGGDRRYGVTIELRAGGPMRTADLYVRGNEHFAVHAPRPGGRSLWAGYDGEVGWIAPAPALMPVIVNADPEAILERLGERVSVLPLFEFESLLVSLRDRFELTATEEPPLGGPRTPDLHYVRATARPGTGARLPRDAQIAVRRRDGVIETLVAIWPSPARTRRAVFRRLDDGARSDDWYGFEAHTDPGRAVRRF